MSNKWLITKNLDKVEAQCKSKYIEKDFKALLKHDWTDYVISDLVASLPDYFESAMIKGYLVAINDFKLMLEGVDVDVSDILDE